MSKLVRLDAEAHEELDAAIACYDAQTGREDIGTELMDAVERALKRIGRAPAASPLALERSAGVAVRRYRLRKFPYALFFIELANEIRVLAVAHVRRRPGYWRSRL